ncbi:hypothetical protein ACOMHN_023510 [Nucella lapillus]
MYSAILTCVGEACRRIEGGGEEEAVQSAGGRYTQDGHQPSRRRCRVRAAGIHRTVINLPGGGAECGRQVYTGRSSTFQEAVQSAGGRYTQDGHQPSRRRCRVRAAGIHRTVINLPGGGAECGRQVYTGRSSTFQEAVQSAGGRYTQDGHQPSRRRCRVRAAGIHRTVINLPGGGADCGRQVYTGRSSTFQEAVQSAGGRYTQDGHQPSRRRSRLRAAGIHRTVINLPGGGAECGRQVYTGRSSTFQEAVQSAGGRYTQDGHQPSRRRCRVRAAECGKGREAAQRGGSQAERAGEMRWKDNELCPFIGSPISLAPSVCLMGAHMTCHQNRSHLAARLT